MNLFCFVIICALCVFSVPALAAEADVSSSFGADEQLEVEAYTMPISELIPTAEGTPQPNSMNMQSESTLTAAASNMDNELPPRHSRINRNNTYYR